MMRRFGIAQALIGHPQLLIVDEPTAGLDPEERNRFYNLLAEIGEEVTVILSTHIVEDIAVLCPNMAVISDGGVVLQGTPTELMGNLEGQIWEKRIGKSALHEYEQRYETISTHFVAGQRTIRIKSMTTLEGGFRPASANLEDVYFCAIKSSQYNSLNHHNRDL
jgi:ABC-type multidrug transport system ATPase subunit